MDATYRYQPSSVVCRSVCHSSCAKTAELIEMPLGCGFGWVEESMCYMGAHWRHLANTIEPSLCGGDAALCRITLTTCLT